MGIVKTKKVELESGKIVIINESDFDSETQKEVGAKEKHYSQMGGDELKAKASELGIKLKGDEKNKEMKVLIKAELEALKAKEQT